MHALISWTCLFNIRTRGSREGIKLWAKLRVFVQRTRIVWSLDALVPRINVLFESRPLFLVTCLNFVISYLQKRVFIKVVYIMRGGGGGLHQAVFWNIAPGHTYRFSFTIAPFSCKLAFQQNLLWTVNRNATFWKHSSEWKFLKAPFSCFVVDGENETFRLT